MKSKLTSAEGNFAYLLFTDHHCGLRMLLHKIECKQHMLSFYSHGFLGINSASFSMWKWVSLPRNWENITKDNSASFSHHTKKCPRSKIREFTLECLASFWSPWTPERQACLFRYVYFYSGIPKVISTLILILDF